jgi:predicted RNase H-like HicB family nuclease
MKDGQKYIELTFQICTEDGQYAARCVELGTATCGDTFEEAERNLRDAVSLDVNSLEAYGERSRFFRERGIRIKTYRKPSRPVRSTLSVYPDTWAARERIPVGA